MADEDDDRDESDEAGEQGEMFPDGFIEGGSKSLRSLIKPGLTNELTCSIGKAEVPMRGGLPDPDKPVRVLVTAVFHKAEEIAGRDPDTPRVSSWKTRVSLRSEYVETVPDTDEGLITQRFTTMLEADPNAAAFLLDELQKLTAGALQTA